MASTAAAQATLCRLRRDIARIEGRLAEAERLVLDALPAGTGEPSAASGSADRAPDHAFLCDPAGLRPRRRRGRVRLGATALDRILGGGLPLATLHEIRAGESRDGGAAAGFASALLARLST